MTQRNPLDLASQPELNEQYIHTYLGWAAEKKDIKKGLGGDSADRQDTITKQQSIQGTF